MKTVVKTTLAMVAATAIFTGCSVEDAATSMSDSVSDSGGSAGVGSDNITVSKTGEGFMITWTKKSSGYSEVIYTYGTKGARGNGYPITNNATGTYFLNCTEKAGHSTDSYVGYNCSRPDLTLESSVRLKKGTQYQWLVSYGSDHTHGEVEATMEYSGDMLIID